MIGESSPEAAPGAMTTRPGWPPSVASRGPRRSPTAAPSRRRPGACNGQGKASATHAAISMLHRTLHMGMLRSCFRVWSRHLSITG